MNIHIGERIKKRAKELRIGSTELAGRVNTTGQNIAGIYKRASLDSHLLYEISKALSFNFFSLYDVTGFENPKEDTARKELEVLRKDFATLQKELALVKENNELLKKIESMKTQKLPKQPKKSKKNGV